MKTIYHFRETRTGVQWSGFEVDETEVANRRKELRRIDGHIALYVRDGSIDQHRDEMDKKLMDMVMPR
jgi:hypothetical protein